MMCNTRYIGEKLKGLISIIRYNLLLHNWHVNHLPAAFQHGKIFDQFERLTATIWCWFISP